MRTVFQDSLRQATLTAWGRIVDSLFELIFDSGLTVHDVNALTRRISVQAAVRRIANEDGRVSNSRIAIMTGLSRSEVARGLKLKERDSLAQLARTQPIRRVLNAWYTTAAFLNPSGRPATLRIFGRGQTFEQLVRVNGGGIPVRAMLDQLLQMKAVEVMRDGRVRAKTRKPKVNCISAADVANLGDRTADMIDALRINLKQNGRFFGNTSAEHVDLDLLPIVRKEIEARSSVFIEHANQLFKRSKSKPESRPEGAPQAIRIGVTLFYFESAPIKKHDAAPRRITRRKNLKRKALK